MGTKRGMPIYRRLEWVYDWKKLPSSTPISSWIAILLVTGIFAVLILTVRVKLVEPVEWHAPQASVLRLNGEDWSRALMAEARAKGPFPSRFDPDGWEGTAGMQAKVEEATQLRLEGHQPRLMPFPELSIEPPRMARRGEPVFPKRSLEIEVPSAVENLSLQPVLSAVDGIEVAELPEALPEWTKPVTERLASRPWRFLVELDRAGRVRQSVSLAGGNELSPVGLSAWLQGVVFRAKPRDEGRRWVAIAIEFQNLIQEDGTDPE